MALKKCFKCNKVSYAPYRVTEITKEKKINSYDLCKKCGDAIVNIDKKSEISIELSQVKTPEQLFDFICGVKQLKKKSDKPPCPQCGFTIEDFDKTGRFGCQTCYNHFTEKMEELVYPYHKANSHVGKMPKKYWADKCNSSVEEKTKLLKLQLAKAIELEEYEKASQIKLEIRQLNQSSCEDQ